MLDGSISNNSSAYGGGAFFVISDTLEQTITIKGGKMTNNTAPFGGFMVVYTSESSTDPRPVINLEAGNITSNKATAGNGGAFFLNGATFTMLGGEISSNTATANGGAIYSTNKSPVTISNGTISNNAAGSTTSSTGTGGAIALYCGALKVNGGSIINNRAYQASGGTGGGLYVDCHTSGQASLAITSGTITGNSRYGVVYHGTTVSYSKTGGNVSSNTPDNILKW